MFIDNHVMNTCMSHNEVGVSPSMSRKIGSSNIIRELNTNSSVDLKVVGTSLDHQRTWGAA